MKISESLNYIKNQLAHVSGEYALSEAEMILQHVARCSRSDLYLMPNVLIFKRLQDELEAIVERRKHHEPLPYILGTAYFHSKEFLVNSDVLIPRPETEILVELILKSERKKYCFFLDMGIGSGAISAILSEANPNWRGIGIDISFSALGVARINCPENVHLLNNDLFTSMKQIELFDFIVCNPPYISASEMNRLDKSVKDFEPPIALYGGKDGLDFYRSLAMQAKKFLKPEGRMYCEIGNTQGGSVQAIFSAFDWKDINIMHDLARRPRVVSCKR